MRIRILKTVLLAALVSAGAGGARLAYRSTRMIHPYTGKAIVVPGHDSAGTLLFNGWRITPAGRPVDTGDMPMGGAISPDGSTLAIVNSGWGGNALNFLDIRSEKLIGKVSLGRSWSGLAWAPDGNTLYLAGGINNTVNDVYRIVKGEDGQFARGTGIKIDMPDHRRAFVTGLALSRDGSTLYVLDDTGDTLYTVDAAKGELLGRVAAGDHPVCCQISADGRHLFVADWGGAEVNVVDISDPHAPLVTGSIPTGTHPNALALGTDGRLFVSCGNSDCVTIADATSLKAEETVRTSLTARAPHGATPDALALSPNGRALYVTNADNNDVCVIDVSHRRQSRVRGFIPAGWYPTAVAVTPDGSRLMVSSGKGLGSTPNPAKAPINPTFPTGFEYIAHQLRGSVSFVDVPDDRKLKELTQQVVANTPYRDSQLTRSGSDADTVLPSRVGGSCPIKYVLYIIKENRTYDQVFGDMPKGNGDPSLVLFGSEVTPNHHALADQFVLLDNLYCNGEVSADGHPWSDSAIATDFVQRSWVLSYSVKGETNHTASVDDPDDGYLWDDCLRHGISYRSYGEEIHAVSADAPPEQSVGGTTGLVGHGSARYIGAGWPKNKQFRDVDRADVFIDELHAFEKAGKVPHFMIMSLGEDHTRGTTPGAYTPKAAVASNDLALGKIVDAVSHSSIWPQTAIFVIEDDAQNGPDHVDSHRTAGLVISPYIKRHTVDSTMYTTTSMVRTMELILGLPPLTQYDAAANSMAASFARTPDLTPYHVVQPQIDIAQRNSSIAYGARESSKMDWSDYDRVDEDKLNAILWHSIKGASCPMPAPVRGIAATR